MNAKSVVVTGVSTGIGRGIVAALVRQGFRVFGTVRREVDAASLRAEFGEAFTPLLADVTDDAAVRRAVESVRAALGEANLAGLVNNAGISLVGPLLHQPLDDVRSQLDVNLIAPLRLVQAFAPLLGTDRRRQGGPGRIINISSVGGKIAIPLFFAAGPVSRRIRNVVKSSVSSRCGATDSPSNAVYVPR